MPKSKYFRIGYGIILFLFIIYLGAKVDFIFKPIGIFFQTLFFPFLISGVIYYLLRPVVFCLNDWKVPKSLAIVAIYLLFIGLGTILLLWIGPELQRQFKSLVENYPAISENLRGKFLDIRENKWVSRFEENDYFTLEEASSKVSAYFQANMANVFGKVTNVIGIITSILTLIVTVPFIVFYLLRDGEGASAHILKYLPYLQAAEARKILKDMDEALSSYIKGQAIVSLLVGVMMYIGYLIIGIDYSLVLASVAMLTNVIPFIGPFIAIIPAIIIAFLTSPFMALKVLIVAVVVQQIDGNITSPYIMGRNLDIHPLTIILLLLVAGSLGGLLGMIIAVPVYAVVKVILSHTYRLYLLHKNKERMLEVE
ncbi:putative PurR-regulated permease PerM [Mesobacillus foraminis]|uniref:Putative PurR-regulated permease PerM n=1 Tax=Mesobacillus foraminis TaxID=279826 RepID=A0A4R2BQ65_9BACI|nr:AI-2E family transporter [Mesobacillus foraminis]TCN28074.1 putative PurR-regulated permease PerM [Mesobacillus foraminis]